MAIVLSGGISKVASNVINNSAKKMTGVAGNLEYVKMLNNDLLTVRVITPYRNIIKAAMGDDFSFSLGNHWNPLVSINSIPILGDLSQGALATAGAIAGATQASMESLWMTSASWSGYEMPKFKIDMTFLNYSSQVNFFNDMLSLAEGMLPPELDYDTSKAGDMADVLTKTQDFLGNVASSLVEKATEFEEKDGFLQPLRDSGILSKQARLLEAGVKQIGVSAPMGYGLMESTNYRADTVFKPKPNTTFGLRIGNWFEASNLLMETGDIRFSKEVTPSGSPVLLTVGLVFRPYRNISFKEFAGWFRKHTLPIEPPKGVSIDKGGSK